jgi:hypothetical protein
VRLELLYRVQFSYTGGWGADLAGPENPECQFFFLAEGRCEGRISGQFRGANHPHRRSDGTFLPNFQGVIETDDGAEVLFDYRGYGRAYPIGRRQIVVCATHRVWALGRYAHRKTGRRSWSSSGPSWCGSRSPTNGECYQSGAVRDCCRDRHGVGQGRLREQGWCPSRCSSVSKGS